VAGTGKFELPLSSPSGRHDGGEAEQQKQVRVGARVDLVPPSSSPSAHRRAEQQAGWGHNSRR